MFQRDWLLRLVEQIAEMTAKALTLANEGRHEEANRELDRAYRDLSLPRDLVSLLDARSITMMVGEKRAALIQLLEAEIEVMRLAGNEAAAKQRERLVAQL